MKKAFLNISYTLVSNIISFVLSALITFIVPKVLGVESYAYLQLYFFYTSYIGFLHFGWADGIFLRYGGEYYDNLDKPKISGQFWLFASVELLFGLLISFVGYATAPSQDKAIIFLFLGVAVILTLPKTLLHYILQGTGKIKEYASLTILERTSYVCTVLIALLCNLKSYEIVISADLLGKAITLIFTIYKFKDIIITKPPNFIFVIKEALINICIGSKLMFSNIASLLIVGIVKLSIEHQWSVATFGKVSLTMAVSNLLMIFISAVSLVMFPMLRRTDIDKLSGIYSKMRTCLMLPLLGMLILYYPGKVLLSAWLPQYAESLKYMAMLFPMCVFESKMSMLISTYMKTLRLEKKLLFVNVVTLCLSFIATGITCFWIHDLDLAVLSIVILLAFRCILAESILSCSLEIKVKKDISLEVALTIIFIFSSWVIGGIHGITVYCAIYVCYLFVQKRRIIELLEKINSIAKSIKQ